MAVTYATDGGPPAPRRSCAASRKRRPPVLGGARKGPLKGLGRPSWKVVGLAGIAGVAATGVVVARNRRAHRELPPDELRERLHRRLAEVGADPGAHADGDSASAPPSS